MEGEQDALRKKCEGGRAGTRAGGDDAFPTAEQRIFQELQHTCQGERRVHQRMLPVVEVLRVDVALRVEHTVPVPRVDVQFSQDAHRRQNDLEDGLDPACEVELPRARRGGRGAREPAQSRCGERMPRAPSRVEFVVSESVGAQAVPPPGLPASQQRVPARAHQQTPRAPRDEHDARKHVALEAAVLGHVRHLSGAAGLRGRPRQPGPH
mmetsp:Transcript_5852/g.23143  ORF Transcript_5852/g.23143 Transcript_5852/m.23143 type:complete len:209 (+) Transcript_5852:622-1248(+)